MGIELSVITKPSYQVNVPPTE